MYFCLSLLGYVGRVDRWWPHARSAPRQKIIRWKNVKSWGGKNGNGCVIVILLPQQAPDWSGIWPLTPTERKEATCRLCGLWDLWLWIPHQGGRIPESGSKKMMETSSSWFSGGNCQRSESLLSPHRLPSTSATVSCLPPVTLRDAQTFPLSHFPAFRTTIWIIIIIIIVVPEKKNSNNQLDRCAIRQRLIYMMMTMMSFVHSSRSGKVSKRSWRWIAERMTILPRLRVFSVFFFSKLNFYIWCEVLPAGVAAGGRCGDSRGRRESSEQCPALLTPSNKENSLFLLWEKCFRGNARDLVRCHSKKSTFHCRVVFFCFVGNLYSSPIMRH